ncbi:MauE/DoxX family redox-associated membrane protein [Pedobacter insulae]|uniref:Methylamine utilisation protein MauE n=1 Tax=Pedobacter insulae TaxID=414048 RepID=A0A1I2Y252_9SPHI|nr:MauE/DoxX family redox-associated membrane protein [Pedobacter insulae]SFH19429.1 Methylamine utilisation protein MauE [Pedobacter insulae]
MKSFLLDHKEQILIYTCTILVFLWIYTALSKLSDLTEFKKQLDNQTFGNSTATFLFWFIPISELTAAALLLFRKTRYAGLMLSTLLMFLFTGYIALVLLGFYERTPCSCGGVLKEMSWQMHLWFNIFFLLLSGLGIFLARFPAHSKKRIRNKSTMLF